MNCKITEQQTRQIMRLDGDVTLHVCNFEEKRHLLKIKLSTFACICVYLNMKLYYISFLSKETRRGGAVEGLKKYCEYNMFIYVKYTGLYSVIQCI